MKKGNIIAILPAYNAAKTLVPFLRSLPHDVFDEIILVDDCSTDGTLALAQKQSGITVYRTPRNLGYGGNLKMCLGRALEHGADIVMELHPDGEYGTDGIKPALGKVESGAHLVLGNRFVGSPKGMYWQKIITTRLLTALDNMIFGTNIPDMHQGFRVYTRKLLAHVNYRGFANDYLFSFQIIAAALATGHPVDWVPVSAHYRGKKRGAPWKASVRYVAGTFAVLAAFLMGRYKKTQHHEMVCPVCKQWYLVEYRLSLGQFHLWFCHSCLLGFSSPVPDNPGQYYSDTYWHALGLLGWAKTIVFGMAQKRRVRWVSSRIDKGEVLDVGAGSGAFGKSVGREFRVTSLDPYYPGNHASIIKQDFLTWKTTKRFDAIVFWESLEHTPNPDAYIARAAELLAPGGILCIEYPRWDSVERVLFGMHWFHLDIPRHLMHFSDRGLTELITKHNLTIQKQQGVFALEYAPLGFLFSMLNACGLERYRNWFLPLGIFLLPVSVIEHGIGQSPIGLLIAQKDATMKHQL